MALVTLGFFGSSVLTVHGATIDWTGAASTDWNTGGPGGNWNGAAVPTSAADTARFGDVAATTTVADISSAASIQAIIFSNGVNSAAFTIQGASTLTIAGASGDDIFNGSGFQQTFNVATISITAAASFNAGNVLGGSLVFGGTTLDLGANALTIDGSNNTTISNVITGTGGIAKIGTGTLTLGGNNTFTGTLAILDGTVSVANLNSLGNGSTPIIVGGSGSTGTLEYTGATASTSKAFALGSVGAFRIEGDSTELTLSGDVDDVIDGSGGLTKSGSGVLVLGGTANYGGATVIDGGVLRLALTSGILGGNFTLNDGVMEYEFTSGITEQRQLGNGNGQIQILGGTSGFSARGSTLTVALEFGGTLTWNSSFFNPTRFVLNETTATAALDLQNGLDLNGADRTINVNANVATISGAIVNGTGTAGLIKGGAGTLGLTAANTYNGATAIQDGVVQLSGGNNRLPTGTTVTLGNGATSGKLILGNGVGISDQTLAGLTTSGSGTANAVVGGNSSASTLTLDITSGTSTFGGTLGGGGANENNLALKKTGSGTLVLNRANTYTGGTTLGNGSPNTGGAITLGADDALGTGGFTFAGGILNANDRSDSTIGALSLTADSTLNLSVGGIAGSLTFSSASWTGGILTINNWSGDASGTDDKIFIQADPGATFLGKIQFTGHESGATWLGTGEIVPVPEPINVALGLFGAAFAILGLARSVIRWKV